MPDCLMALPVEIKLSMPRVIRNLNLDMTLVVSLQKNVFLSSLASLQKPAPIHVTVLHGAA